MIFDLIADPARQPQWDGNNNLLQADSGQRVLAAGDTFVMNTRKGNVRVNHVDAFEEGRLIAWRPGGVGTAPFGHRGMWELQPVAAAHTLVRHTYDWRDLTDEDRTAGARRATSDRLLTSIERLAAVAEGPGAMTDLDHLLRQADPAAASTPDRDVLDEVWPRIDPSRSATVRPLRRRSWHSCRCRRGSD